ncbi:TK protein kinase [Salpingoeca rosetta]|uniref:TK protein kinase n=1 Tax=Salpingoeca rosetta (strain ATCC 50818 / BSB-021) TaxID=946362 RepID=F2UR92_SALR5|nr:TK protein kinase [Salpingoeca rosetta]EGD80195.1 TK protein kinase [Salpingoeca rosetta]|eukprot:XP_004988257.1 TK protein kinase [Salpingoeca rosetta]
MLNMSVVADAYPQPTYQWYRGNTLLAGATAPTLIIANVSAARDGGMYSVQICNALDCKESENAVVRVNAAPELTATGVRNTTAVLGDHVSWTPTVAGIPFPTVTWYRISSDGGDGSITNMTTTAVASTLTLSFASVAAADEGMYFATLSNHLATVRTPLYSLVVITPPRVVHMSPSRHVLVGTRVALFVDAVSKDPAPLTYQWLHASTVLVGANSPSLIISAATPNDAGDYTVQIKNVAGTTVSKPIRLNVTDDGATVQADVQSGGLVVLTAPGGGDTYTWTANGNAINTTDANTITFAPPSAGTYTFTVVIFMGDDVRTVVSESPLVFSATHTQTTANTRTTTAPASRNNNNSDDTNTYIIIGGAVGGFLVIVAVILLAAVAVRRRRRRKQERDVICRILDECNNPLNDEQVREWTKEICPGPLGFEVEKPEMIDPKNVKLCDHVVARGDIARIQMANYVRNGTAIPAEAKILSSSANDEARRSFMVEAHLLHNLRHKNILRIFGVSVAGQAWCIVTELPFRGRLKNFLRNHAHNPEMRELGDKQKAEFALDIAKGMQFLASYNCIHRALIAAHVAISEDWTCKIGEFGFARRLHRGCDEYEISSQVFLSRWQAPEVLNEHKYRLRSDVWSYGVVLHEIWSKGRDPYTTDGWNAHNFVERLNRRERMAPPSDCPKRIYDMMRDCWHPDDHLRPSFNELVDVLTALVFNGDFGAKDFEVPSDFYQGQYIDVSGVEDETVDMDMSDTSINRSVLSIFRAVMGGRSARTTRRARPAQASTTSATMARTSRFSFLYGAMRGRGTAPVLAPDATMDETFSHAYHRGSPSSSRPYSVCNTTGNGDPENHYSLAADLHENASYTPNYTPNLSPIRGDASISSSFSEPAVADIKASPRVGRMVLTEKPRRTPPMPPQLARTSTHIGERVPKADLIPKPADESLLHARKFPSYAIAQRSASTEEPVYAVANGTPQPTSSSSSSHHRRNIASVVYTPQPFTTASQEPTPGTAQRHMHTHAHRKYLTAMHENESLVDDADYYYARNDTTSSSNNDTTRDDVGNGARFDDESVMEARATMANSSRVLRSASPMYTNATTVQWQKHLQRARQQQHAAARTKAYEVVSPENFKKDDSLVGSENMSIFDADSSARHLRDGRDASTFDDFDDQLQDLGGEMLDCTEVDSIDSDEHDENSLHHMSQDNALKKKKKKNQHQHHSHPMPPMQRKRLQRQGPAPPPKVDFVMCGSPGSQQALEELRAMQANMACRRPVAHTNRAYHGNHA